ncbi:MAG TPA: hypothetical protein VLQ91_02395 [Draconibacterium sp.]|nr:hypothetical protein [Draconibacterium sp.]
MVQSSERRFDLAEKSHKSELEDKQNDNSYASGTPATDGKFVYVLFMDGENVVAELIKHKYCAPWKLPDMPE